VCGWITLTGREIHVSNVLLPNPSLEIHMPILFTLHILLSTLYIILIDAIRSLLFVVDRFECFS